MVNKSTEGTFNSMTTRHRRESSNTDMDQSLRSLLGSSFSSASSTRDRRSDSLRSLLDFSSSEGFAGVPNRNGNAFAHRARQFGRSELVQVIDEALHLLDSPSASNEKSRGEDGRRDGERDSGPDATPGQ